MSDKTCPDCRLPENLHEEIASALEAGGLSDEERGEIARFATALPAPALRLRRGRLQALIPLVAAAAVMLAAVLLRGGSPETPEPANRFQTVDDERAANYRAYFEAWDRLSSLNAETYVVFAGGRFVAAALDPAEADRRSRALVPGARQRLFFRIADAVTVSIYHSAGGGSGADLVLPDAAELDPLYEMPGWTIPFLTRRGPVVLRRYCMPDGETGTYRIRAGVPGGGPPPLRIGDRVWPHAGDAVHEAAVRAGKPVLELRGNSGLAPHALFDDSSIRSRLGDFTLSHFFFENPIRVEVGDLTLDLDPAPRLVVLGTEPPRPGASPMYRVRGEGADLFDRDELPLAPGVTAHDIATFLDRFRSEAGFHWVRIPGGPFWFGPPGRADRRVVPAFEITVYEVTNRQWKRYCEEKGVPFTVPIERLDHPVTGVSFEEVREFCAWAGARLPTEEEWQKAARGSEDKRAWPWGDDWPGPGSPANVRDVGLADTLPVGTFSRDVSPYGVHDLGGNVSEFVGYPERSGGAWVGGCYLDDRLDARVWGRTEVAPGVQHTWPYVGFRMVRSVE